MDDDLFVQPTDPGQIYDGSDIITVNNETDIKQEEQKYNKHVEKEGEQPILSGSSEPITTSLAMPFQQKIVTDMLSEDGLLIIGKGMGLLNVIVNLIHCLDVIGIGISPEPSKTEAARTEIGDDNDSDKGNSLVIVVGAADDDNDKIREGLRELSSLFGLYDGISEFADSNKKSRPRRGLTVFNESVTKTKRQQAYNRGGVFSVTSTVIVGDMLSNTIDRKLISGIVVLNAHQVKEDSGVAFLLSLYRDVNEAGFIKALSDQPERFATGFSTLSKHLKWLRVRRLWLWPRFHVKVRQVLDSNRDVVEVAVWPSDSMNEIAKSLRAVMETCLSELRQLSVVKQNVENANENWTIDKAVHRNFMTVVRVSLAPVWHQMRPKSKQLVYDIGELLQLLERSATASPVTFLTDLTCMHRLARIALLKGMTSWIEHPAADQLMKTARERVFQGDVEEPPKWDQLGNILDEISILQQKNLREGANNGPVLVMCSSFPTELRSAITKMKNVGGVFTAKSYMDRRRKEFRQWQNSLVNIQTLYQSGLSMQHAKTVANQARPEATQPNRPGFVKRRRVRGGAASAATSVEQRPPPSQLSEPQMDFEQDALSTKAGNNETEDAEVGYDDNDDNDDNDDENDPVEVEGVTTKSEFNNDVHVLDMSDVVIVQKYDNSSEDETLLQELQPSYIIMYDPDLAFVRRIEEYRFSHTAKVYFMYYKDSVEEEKFLASIRREKDTFTNLIQEKAKMPIILDTEIKPTEGLGILRAVSSRIAGGQKLTTEKPRVIVDARELKSSLPFQIYKHECEVIPATLTVGDYVLTPDLCVERKSISDLTQSLNSGRLYKQCIEMCKHYDLPTLLIEFDEAKSFSSLSMGESERMKNSDMEKLLQESVQSKLTLLFLTFPKLKCIWSSSPFQTAEIFVDLKQGRAEPVVGDSINFGRRRIDTSADDSGEVENDDAIAMLQSIPGINHTNYRQIIEKVNNIKELCLLSEPQLADIIGKQAARTVCKFLRAQSTS